MPETKNTAAEQLKNSNNTATEAGAEALNSKAKGEVKKQETPLEFIVRMLEGDKRCPFLVKLNLNLTTLKKNFSEFESEFVKKFTQPETPAAITATHAKAKWAELVTQREFAKFLLDNQEKFITPSNPNSEFAKAELKFYVYFCQSRAKNIEKRPDAIGAYEALYGKNAGTTKQALKDENEALKAEIALLKAKAADKTA